MRERESESMRPRDRKCDRNESGGRERLRSNCSTFFAISSLSILLA